jgi:solute carrier family 24 (sodium/potassium/calcium exchanger), member 6
MGREEPCGEGSLSNRVPSSILDVSIFLKSILKTGRTLTIPPGEEDKFHWVMGLVYPFGCTIFAVFAT